jgi:hypothetical protein
MQVTHELVVFARAIALGEDDAIERYRQTAVQVD